jgi:hypothetical protein
MSEFSDGFDADAADPTASPIKGPEKRFKDGGYVEFGDEVDEETNKYAVRQKLQGWQKLERDCPPEYVMRKIGEPRPARPHVDEANWPLDLNGKPAHPWKLTNYLVLLNIETGEISTFSTNTIGGNIAIGELSDQVEMMRQEMPGAVPIIALQSKDMPTQYGGTKPRPYFKITGYRQRGGADQAIAAPTAQAQLEDFTENAKPAPEPEIIEPEKKTVTKAGVTKITTGKQAVVDKHKDKPDFQDEVPF